MSRRKIPTDAQIDVAAAWLAVNEGDGAEMEACHVVAEWLEQEAHERMLRQKAREGGVTVKQLRLAMTFRSE